jgi:hypothetical protein
MSILEVTVEEALPVALSRADAATACRDALERLRWKIDASEPDGFTVRDAGHFIGRPRDFVILLADDGSGGTTITLKGALLGGGPLMKAALNKSLSKLRTAIEERAGAAGA